MNFDQLEIEIDSYSDCLKYFENQIKDSGQIDEISKVFSSNNLDKDWQLLFEKKVFQLSNEWRTICITQWDKIVYRHS